MPTNTLKRSEVWPPATYRDEENPVYAPLTQLERACLLKRWLEVQALYGAVILFRRGVKRINHFWLIIRR